MVYTDVSYLQNQIQQKKLGLWKWKPFFCAIVGCLNSLQWIGGYTGIVTSHYLHLMAYAVNIINSPQLQT